MFSATAFAASMFWVWVFAVLVLVLAGGSTDHGSAIAAEDLTDDDYVQPEVHRYTNVLPRDVCEKIIAMGEAAGFPLDEDSIDRSETVTNNSQSIDVVQEDGTVNYPNIYEALEPFLPNIANLIRNQRNEELDRLLFPEEPPNRLPKLGWIFYRKYSPETIRNSLCPHYDSNMHTVNIALNDDFTGGGLFYVKPAKSINPDYFPSAENNYFRGKNQDGVPDLNDYQYTYDFTNSLRHKNMTDIVFPELESGDALIHNFTVWHAVAPIETGTRYSMVLFYDQENPCLSDDDDDDDWYDDDDDDWSDDDDDDLYDEEDDYDEDDYDKDSFDVNIRHEIRDCDPTTGKLVLIRDDIKIFWVDPDESEGSQLKEVASDDVSPGAWTVEITRPGAMFRAVRSMPDEEEYQPPETREVLGFIVIESGKVDYEFVSMFTTQNDCDIANRKNENEL